MSTVAGFIAFIRAQMGISTAVLPDSSASITDAYALAVEVVNPVINEISTLVYDLCVYNLGGDNLINFAVDRTLTNTTITWLSNVATVTTSAAHGLTTGTSVLVSRTAPAGYSSAVTVPIIVTGATTYTFSLTTNPGACTQAGITSLTYFTDLRKSWNITGFAVGVVTSSADVATSETLTTPDYAKNLSLAELQYIKTPYGRQYMAYAQRYGTIWGLT